MIETLLSSKLIADKQDALNKNGSDYKVDIYEANDYSYTNVYGEIKPSKGVSLTLLVNDFYRVAIFSKDAVDKFNLKTVFGFQATGLSITWVVMNLAFESMYVFTEIASMEIPLKKSGLPSLLGQLDDMHLISKVHKAACVPASNSFEHLICLTLPAVYFENMAGKKSIKN